MSSSPQAKATQSGKDDADVLLRRQRLVQERPPQRPQQLRYDLGQGQLDGRVAVLDDVRVDRRVDQGDDEEHQEQGMADDGERFVQRYGRGQVGEPDRQGLGLGVWYGKGRNSIETSAFGGEFTARKTGTELLRL